MKQVVILSGPELQEAALQYLARRKSLEGRHVAAIHLISDSSATDPRLRIRANVVTFDTEKLARAYADDVRSNADSIDIVVDA